MKTLIPLLFLCVAVPTSLAQEGATPDSADVASVDAIIDAMYDAISGPAGVRDWDRLRSLATPSCRLTPIRQDSLDAPVHATMTVEEFVQETQDYFEQNGFFENEVARKTESYGNVAHAFSTYELFHSLEDAAPFQRGINSVQLIYSRGRWWVHSVTWQPEWSDLPIPEKYLSAHDGP